MHSHVPDVIRHPETAFRSKPHQSGTTNRRSHALTYTQIWSDLVLQIIPAIHTQIIAIKPTHPAHHAKSNANEIRATGKRASVHVITPMRPCS